VVSGAAYCWGANNPNGQLGTGDTVTAPAPVAVSGGLSFAALTAGDTHVCGITTSGQLYCWGGNAAGQLGDGTFTQKLTPTLIP
jgi:alpha-tubulin suppressor-like RCC1 family protein